MHLQSLQKIEIKIDMIFEKLLLSIKKNKIFYYSLNHFRQLIPSVLYQKSLTRKILSSSDYDTDYLASRLNYYNKLNQQKEVGTNAILLEEMNKIKGSSVYYFDTFQYTRYFRKSLKANFLFMDVIHVPDAPTLQKSRPIGGHNENAVILKMEKKRHFLFVKDPYQFL